jgi:hypothetical protein
MEHKQIFYSILSLTNQVTPQQQMQLLQVRVSILRSLVNDLEIKYLSKAYPATPILVPTTPYQTPPTFHQFQTQVTSPPSLASNPYPFYTTKQQQLPEQHNSFVASPPGLASPVTFGLMANLETPSANWEHGSSTDNPGVWLHQYPPDGTHNNNLYF